MQQVSRLIIVGGAPRSGTTLVQNMLDSHPDIVGGPEFLHLKDIVSLRNGLHGSIDREWITLYCDKPTVDSKIAEFSTDLLLSILENQPGKWLSEKTPENVLVFSELIEIFKDAKFLHIVRDPRAIVASMLEVGRRAVGAGEVPAPFTANLSAAIQYTRRCQRAGFRAAEAYPDRVHTIFYEELVAEPQKQLEMVCSFIGVQFNPDMLRPGEKKHLGELAITQNSGEIWYDKKTYYSNPNVASVDKWQSQLSTADQYRVCRAMSMLPQLNERYQLSSNKVGRLTRLRLALSMLLERLTIKVRSLFTGNRANVGA